MIHLMVTVFFFIKQCFKVHYQDLQYIYVSLFSAPHPTSRWGHTMCLTDSNTAVVIGGQGERQQLSKDSVWCLDTGQLKWNPVQNLNILLLFNIWCKSFLCFLFFLEGEGDVQTLHGSVSILIASLASYFEVDCDVNCNSKKIYWLMVL